MKLLVKNIGRIVGIETEGRLRRCGAEMDRLDTLDDAWLLTDGERIAAFGRMTELGETDADRIVDAGGGMLFRRSAIRIRPPGLCREPRAGVSGQDQRPFV